MVFNATLVFLHPKTFKLFEVLIFGIWAYLMKVIPLKMRRTHEMKYLRCYWNRDQRKFVCLFAWWCLTPLSTIFQLYRGGQFYWWGKPEYPEKTTDCRTSLINCIVWAGFELTALVMTAPQWTKNQLVLWKNRYWAKKKDHDIWHRKSRSWLEQAHKCGGFF
jgi:hypothetical protein